MWHRYGRECTATATPDASCVEQLRGLATSVVSKGLCAELVLVVQYFIQRTARLHLALHSAVTLLPVATAGVDAALQRQRQGHTRRALPTQCT